ncbi:MAG: hypothetical protein ABFD92_11850 [Planctomycetaceae bacterium]|nr:hypothetical protein [Planctomycetaceae bacterium]
MICSFCGKEFDEAAARKSCGGCSLMGGCRKLKCPHCDYEMPEEPRLVKWLRKLWKKR